MYHSVYNINPTDKQIRDYKKPPSKLRHFNYGFQLSKSNVEQLNKLDAEIFKVSNRWKCLFEVWISFPA